MHWLIRPSGEATVINTAQTKIQSKPLEVTCSLLPPPLFLIGLHFSLMLSQLKTLCGQNTVEQGMWGRNEKLKETIKRETLQIKNDVIGNFRTVLLMNS